MSPPTYDYLPAWLLLRKREPAQTAAAFLPPLYKQMSPRRKTLYFFSPFLFGGLNGAANLFSRHRRRGNRIGRFLSARYGRNDSFHLVAFSPVLRRKARLENGFRQRADYRRADCLRLINQRILQLNILPGFSFFRVLRFTLRNFHPNKVAYSACFLLPHNTVPTQIRKMGNPLQNDEISPAQPDFFDLYALITCVNIGFGSMEYVSV